MNVNVLEHLEDFHGDDSLTPPFATTIFLLSATMENTSALYAMIPAVGLGGVGVVLTVAAAVSMAEAHMGAYGCG